MAHRRPFVAGNWKLNLGPREARALAEALAERLTEERSVDMAVFPVSISVPATVMALAGSGIEVGGQDAYAANQGAFTGAVSAPMFREAGCTRILVGHSERRSVFGDSNAIVRTKLEAALAAGLLPILCIGETLDERDAGRAFSVVTEQLQAGLGGLPADQVAAITLAYEPVWAIGTGRTASPAQAQEMHAAIRAWVAANFPAFVAEDLRIQYGGSVKPDNAAELLSQPDIDGALVGGASLDADSFARIVEAAASVHG